MKKKLYQNPEMEVVKLNNKPTLLAGSGEVAPGCMTVCGTDED
jgi:hypothetical protein